MLPHFRLALIIGLGGSLTTHADAAFITFGHHALWSSYSAAQGYSVAAENFDGVPSGYLPGGYSATISGVTWTGIADGGVVANEGMLSTNLLEPLRFTFSPGVQGVGGNIFGTNVDFIAVPCVIQVTLADGTSYVNYATSQTDFVGFFSTGAAIATMTISTTAIGADPVWPTIDNLYFTVPAPGALALLGVAGLCSRRRR